MKAVTIFIAAAAALFMCGCTAPSADPEQGGGNTVIPVPEPEPQPGPEYKAFSFIQMSDPQLGFISGETLDFTADSLLLERMVANVNRLKPAFVLMTGDMTNTSRQKDQVACYKMIMEKIDMSVPVYTVPGNHDIGGDASTDRVNAYISNYGEDRFCMTYEGCAFIGIDSPVIKYDNTELEVPQYNWLLEKLYEAKDCRMRFVVSHYPFFLSSYLEAENSQNLSQEARDRYWPVFKRHKVSCVIAGHLHYTRQASYNGIGMITTGAVGKPLGSGFSGAALWKIDKDGKYTYQYLSAGEFDEIASL